MLHPPKEHGNTIHIAPDDGPLPLAKLDVYTAFIIRFEAHRG
jgi:hypothetical protein